MKLGPVTRLDMRNTSILKNFVDDVMSANCDVVVFFSDLWPIAAIWKPDFGHVVYKTYIFINSNLLSYRT